MDALTTGIPIQWRPDEFEAPPGASNVVYVAAPAAGSTPFPAPLAFAPPVEISPNEGAAIRAQRAGSLPAADVDPPSD